MPDPAWHSTDNLSLGGLTWLLIFWGFFVWWAPDEYEFFMPTVIPLTVLALMTLSELGQAVPRAGLHQ